MKIIKGLIRIIAQTVLIAVIAAVAATAAFCGLGAYAASSDRIYPNVSVAGADVSWLTKDEARQAVDQRVLDTQADDAMVTITFPDGSELSVTGKEARLCANKDLMVDAALSSGRGKGFVADALELMRRRISGGGEDFFVSYELDTQYLRSRVDEFVSNYNDKLDSSKARIDNGKIVVVKGAGQVHAGENEVYALAYNGLHESLNLGHPVESGYSLPSCGADTAALNAIRQSVKKDPVDAKYDPVTNTISKEVSGVDFDISAAKAKLDKLESGQTATFDVVYTAPKITHDYLEKLLFRDLIGECTTNIPGTANRLNNIIVAAETVNGCVLQPGEEFSFNGVVGRRTEQRGFKSAPAYSGGQIVQAIGGGVCQVSSTIYSAIMDSSLRVTERHPHGMPVAYLPKGRDATVSWGTLDFKFVNNTQFPLRIDAKVVDRTLTVQVYGTLDKNGA